MHLRTCPNCGQSAGPTDYTCPNCGWDGYDTAADRAARALVDRDEWTDWPPEPAPLAVRHPPGHPLAGMMTMAFLTAAIEVAFGNLCSTGPDFADARQLATINGLLWG